MEKIETESHESGNIDANNENKLIYFPRIIAGPPNAIKGLTENYIRIVPQKSGLSGGKLAQKIKSILITNTDKNLKKWAELISINDILHFLPPGGSNFPKKR
jgi:hypothetical protein